MRRALAPVRPAPALLALALLVTACATANRIEGGVFHSSKGYSVNLPGSGWQVASATDADLELRRAAPAGGMLADVTCGGRVADRSAPLLVRQLTFGLKHRADVRTDEVVVKGRRGARTTLRGTLDDKEVAVDAVSLKEDGCVYDFVYVAPVDDFDDGRLAFQIFVESLTLDSERIR
ncbi:MAG TPA: hypothetical protein VFG27_19670 [Pseudomonadales bacterium]|nr:hypothetical protein [Pseudomonadales bacterium]